MPEVAVGPQVDTSVLTGWQLLDILPRTAATAASLIATPRPNVASMQQVPAQLVR